ncbi:hypothetical protein F5Y05DRAFT_50249 [Hypoxylon sp. FL0543]|nr:hypothetical protein F5Y05DRAFT_50249 [Hypoxylon sp. FL0543]
MAAEDVPLKRFLASEPFKFLVGPDRKEYFIHREVFTTISPVLQVLITGRMREAREGVAVWDDIEERYFLDLCEFAYSGTYTAPRLEDSPRPVPLPYRPQGGAAEVFGRRINRVIPNLGDMDFRPGVTRFFRKYRSPSGARIPYREGIGEKDGTEILLRHANVYVLADRYDVADLRALALYREAEALSTVDDTWDNFPAIVKLIKFTYENTVERDKLRELVTTYLYLKGEELLLHPEMQSLLKDCPDFTFRALVWIRDRWRGMSRRLGEQLELFKSALADDEDEDEGEDVSMEGPAEGRTSDRPNPVSDILDELEAVQNYLQRRRE